MNSFGGRTTSLRTPGLIACCAVLAAVVFGCNNPPKDLSGELKKLGVTKKTAERIVFWRYSEPLEGYVEVPISDPELIEWIWHSIGKSKNYGVWYLPEDEGIYFYVEGMDEPAAVLIVNGRDACRVVGARRYVFNPSTGMRVNMHTVRGLHTLLDEFLDSRENFLLSQPAGAKKTTTKPAARLMEKTATMPSHEKAAEPHSISPAISETKMPGVPIAPAKPDDPQQPKPKSIEKGTPNPPVPATQKSPTSAPASRPAARTAPMPRQD